MKEPRILHGADPCGRRIARIELAKLPGVFATVDAADYDEWLSQGLSPRWYLNADGPRSNARLVFRLARVAGGVAGVARHLLNPGNGRKVLYRDDDRLNLRRSNLFSTPGKARGQTAVDPARTSAERWATA